MATKILISNYPRLSQKLKLASINDGHNLDIITGYDVNVDKKVVNLAIARDLINALFAYEEIYVEGIHLSDIIQVFGIDNVKILLREGLLHIIPDQLLNPVMKREGDYYEPEFFSYSLGPLKDAEPKESMQTDSKWDHLAVIFDRIGVEPKERDVLLYLVDEHSVQIDNTAVINVVKEEINRDITSEVFSNAYNIIKEQNGVLYINTPKVIRLLELNKNCVLGGMLGADSIHCDSGVSQMLQIKAFACMARINSDGVEALQTIELQKGMPDMGRLYYEGYLSLDDIFKIRQSIQGKLFRYWASKDEYDVTQMQQDLMQSVKGFLSSDLGKFCRFIACGVAGVIGLIPGIAASALDSFILEKISNGWHPNLFLDGKLGELLDDCAKIQEEAMKRKEIEKHFHGVGRNDLCPCGSGLKFKKCHGKGL